MKRLSFVVSSAVVLGLGLSVFADQQKTVSADRSAAAGTQNAPAPARQAQAQTLSMAPSHTNTSIADSQNALVKQYCATCHNDRNKNNAGGLTLAGFDAAKVG